jgi:hypothetical protein
LYVVDGNRRIDAFDEMRAKRLTLELSIEQAPGSSADEDRVGFRQPLHPRGEVRRFSQRQLFRSSARANVANDDEAGVDANADLEPA